MDRAPGDPDSPAPRRPAAKRIRRDAGKPAIRGSAMTEMIPLNVKITKRARMKLDNHATLWAGTPRGSLSGIIEWLISENLRSIDVREMSSGEGEGAGENPAP
jgi:hypothetical protein